MDQVGKGFCLLHGKIRLLKKAYIGDKHHPSIHSVSELTDESLIHSFLQLCVFWIPSTCQTQVGHLRKSRRKWPISGPWRAHSPSGSDRMLKTAIIDWACIEAISGRKRKQLTWGKLAALFRCAFLTPWTWVWANSGRWWRTRKPGCCSPWDHKELDMT